MCDKCGSKSPDVELYCKNCGVDLQIFGKGGEKVSISTSAPGENAAQNAVATEPAAPAPSFADAPFSSPSGTFPPPPSPFGDMPGFPVPSPSSPPPDTLPSSSPSAFVSGEGLLSSPRSVPPSTGEPLSGTGSDDQGPVDFSFLGKSSEKKAEEEQNPEEGQPPSSPPQAQPFSPGAFNPGLFKPKEGE